MNSFFFSESVVYSVHVSIEFVLFYVFIFLITPCNLIRKNVANKNKSLKIKIIMGAGFPESMQLARLRILIGKTCGQTWPLIGYYLHFVCLFRKQSTVLDYTTTQSPQLPMSHNSWNMYEQVFKAVLIFFCFLIVSLPSFIELHPRLLSTPQISPGGGIDHF